ncbi:hypothetical protein CBS101457_006872 [Exobasidium rhododendri]|nr:hypothetical protein CBS101457_006872 [Exobasidium rhododendri]
MSSTPEKGLHGGHTLEPVLTNGGHEAVTTQTPLFPDFHRKLADPTAFAWLAFGLVLILFGITLIGARGIVLYNAIVPGALALGSVLLTLATIFEFIAGRTFPATLFGIYSGFTSAFVVLHVPWFGLTGSYSGTTPNTYATGGEAAAEYGAMQGLWLSTFVILTALLLLAATHQSVILIVFLTSLEIFFILHMSDFLVNGDISPDSSLTKASGAFAILSGLISWYMALASLLTKESAYFTLPTFELVKSSI